MPVFFFNSFNNMVSTFSNYLLTLSPGIMFWSIDNDDFRGNCHDKPYPLIEAAKEAYIVKLG